MAKQYLKCRMEKYVLVLFEGISTFMLTFPFTNSNLMAPDEFKNLGFADDKTSEPIPNHAGGATKHKVRDDGKKIS